MLIPRHVSNSLTRSGEKQPHIYMDNDPCGPALWPNCRSSVWGGGESADHVRNVGIVGQWTFQCLDVDTMWKPEIFFLLSDCK